MKQLGCIDQISNGRFRLRLRVRGKQETAGYYDTREEAERERLALVQALRETTEEPEQGETLAHFGHQVLARREVLKLVRDPGSDWSRFNQHVKDDELGAKTLRSIERAPKHVFAWVKRLEEKSLGVQTQRNCLNLLRVIFRVALEKGLVRTNPCAQVRIEGKAGDAWTYLVVDEQLALLQAFGEPERYIAAVALGTGVRAGELVTLRLADVFVDDEEPRIVVRYGKAPNKPTKTGKIRTVPLFGVALDGMRAWLAQLPSYAKKNPLGLVFPRQRGGFRAEEHVVPWAMWKGEKTGAVVRAGITRNVRWHDLRHTCASSLVSGWWGRRWSLQEVKEMLGHTSITTTQRYAHLAPSAIQEAARATSGRVNASQRSAANVAAGAPGASRTPDQSLRKRLLYPLSYEGEGQELGKQRFSQFSAAICAGDSALTHARALAEAVTAGASAETARSLALRLAHEVLASRPVSLAGEVLAGGPRGVTAALELAELVAGGAAESEVARASGDDR